MLQEPIALHGERIEEHAIDVWQNGKWQEVAHATNIGYKRILRFPDVTSTKLRVRVIASRCEAYLSTVSLHHYASRPPMLSCKQDIEGNVTISPKKQDFNWKLHNQDAAANLSAGYTVHYTIDGSQPTAESPIYDKPLALSPVMLKAVAVLNGETGAVMSQQIGYAPRLITLSTTAGSAEGHDIANANDANARSFWKSATEGSDVEIKIDLGENRSVKGFFYVPPTGVSKGLLAACQVKWSTDGITYHDAGEFTFGNIVNEPSARYHYLPKGIDARYIIIRATQLANGNALSVGELGVF